MIFSSTLSSARDLGKDGETTGLNKYNGLDAFGFQLGYYANDYRSIAETATPPLAATLTPFVNTSALTAKNQNPDAGNAAMGSLYNGNITHMVTAMRKTDESVLDILGNNYQYDQLQRIREMKVWAAGSIQTNNDFTGLGAYRATVTDGPSAYQESYTYDKNGNISTLTRNGSGRSATQATIALPMDNFAYKYYTETTGTTTADPGGDAVHTNRLAQVVESDPNNTLYTTDIDNQIPQTATNYQYDPSGQLVKDLQEGIEKIEWTVTGKVKNIFFSATAKSKGRCDLKFIYDPLDRRIAKLKYANDAHTEIMYTYYSYDAAGNVMATYEREVKVASGTSYIDQLYLAEHAIYGTGRLGVENENIQLTSRTFSITGDAETGTNAVYNLPVPVTYEYTYRKAGDKSYELKNRLGNVLVVVSDRKIEYLNTNVYTADVISYSDYSPFGMILDNRRGNDDTYRYGFNGMERDDELKPDGNSYDYGARMYDPRVGRWLSRDAFEAKYTSLSPYVFAGNTPIQAYDPDGRFTIFVNGYCGTNEARVANSLGSGRLAMSLRQCQPYKAYWCSKGDQFLKAAAYYFKDNANTHAPAFVNGESWAASTASGRKQLGREFMTPERIAEYRKAVEGGEALNFVTHSMGTAYSEGMIEVMMQDDVLRAALERGKIIHLSSADASEIDISNQHLRRYQIQTTGDWTLQKADPLTTRDPSLRMTKGVTRFALVNWNFCEYHPDKEFDLYYDAHYDTKAYKFVFEWVRDLENLETQFHYTESVQVGRNNLTTWKYKHHYVIPFQSSTVKFGSIKLGNNYQLYLEKDGIGYQTKNLR